MDKIIVFNPDIQPEFLFKESDFFLFNISDYLFKSNGSYLIFKIYLELILIGDHHSAMLFLVKIGWGVWGYMYACIRR